MHRPPNHHAQAAQHLDPYRTLSLRRDATAAEVTAAYRKLSLLHHPARQRGDGDGDEVINTVSIPPSDGTKPAAYSAAASSSDMFVAVSASYQTLIEPRYRRRYDATTRSKSCTDEETGQHYYPALGLGTFEGFGNALAALPGAPPPPLCAPRRRVGAPRRHG